MENKYITMGFAFIVIIAILTSILAIYMMQKQVLKGPGQEGTVEITGGILPVVDVIIIDDSIVAGISDAIQFSGVVPGNTYTTDLDPLTPAPFPFVIRNNGNVRAHVEIDERRNALQTNSGLFDNVNSKLKYWIQKSQPIIGAPGYDTLDDCSTGDCFTGASCGLQPNPTDSNCIIPVADNGRTVAIKSLNYVDATDEAFLHILIYIDNNEPAGTKSTIITITGSQA